MYIIYSFELNNLIYIFCLIYKSSFMSFKFLSLLEAFILKLIV